MALVMIIVGVSWWRQPDHRRRERSSWIEQARREHLTSLTIPAHEMGARGEVASRSTAVPQVRDVDTDTRAHDQYNAWLELLARSDQGRSPK